MKKNFFLLVILLIHINLFAQSSYIVSITENDLRKVNVNAIMFLDSDLLYMDECYDGPEEWMTFMEYMRITDMKGSAIETSKIGVDSLKLLNFQGGSINVSYSMNLTHDLDYKWYVGVNEAAYANEFGALWTGRSLFLVCDQEKGAEVTFNLPENYRLVVPWKISKTQNKFKIDTISELLNSAFFIGNPNIYEINLGTIDMKLAFAFNSTKEQSQFVSSKVVEILKFYIRTTGITPKSQILLIGSLSDNWQGGVMGSSISMMFKSIPDSSNSNKWGKWFAHELFHQWNGNLLKPSEDDADALEWLQEGLTEYYALRAALSTNLINEGELLQYLGEHFNKYYLASNSISLAGAGNDENYSSAHTYSGGMIMAMILDIEVQKTTKGVYNLDSVLKKLFSETNTSETSLSMNSLRKTFHEVTQANFDTLFKNNIIGTQKPNIKEYLEYCGLIVVKKDTGDTTHYNIKKGTGRTTIQKELYNRLFFDF